VIPETLQFLLAFGWKEVEGGMTYLIHFTNTSLNFWLRLRQKLEERGDPWEESPTLPQPRSNI
jgi:hypothetical protein